MYLINLGFVVLAFPIPCETLHLLFSVSILAPLVLTPPQPFPPGFQPPLRLSSVLVIAASIGCENSSERELPAKVKSLSLCV